MKNLGLFFDITANTGRAKKCRFSINVCAFLVILFLNNLVSFSQVENLKIGEWRHHYSFNNCFAVVQTPTQIIGATTLGLNFLNKSDNSLTTLTKINGLSDYDLSALVFLSDLNAIMIGYANGNIDFIRNGKVYNINDLKIKQIDGSKKINHFLSKNNIVYCSTDFGIILLNLEKLEISSTWYIGNQAGNLKVSQLVINGDDIYAATDKGLRKSSLSGTNPAFFENWKTISPTIDPYNSLAMFGGKLISAIGQKGQTCTLASFVNDQINAFTSIPAFYSLTTNSADELMAVSLNSIYFYNLSLQNTSTISSPVINDIPFSPAFRTGIKDQGGNLWIADFNKGLLKRESSNNFSLFNPQGPATNQCKQLLVAGNNVWTVAGGLTNTWNNAGIKASSSVLTPTGWQHITFENTPGLESVIDFIGVTANPLNPENIFINSWGEGVFEFENQQGNYILKNNFNKSETGLQNIDWAAPSGYVRIGATAFDKNNVLFMTNAFVDNGLVAYFPADKTFLRLSYQSIKSVEGLGTMLMHSNGDKWMVIGRGNPMGLFVWNDNGTPKNQSDDKYKSSISPSKETDKRNVGQLLLWDDKGEEITKRIYSIAEDQNKYVWLGTDMGIVVQYQPRTIFNNEKPVFSRIKIPRKDGSGLADYLLENEIVTAIAVDAGNRKWIGTQGSGVFLVSADGTKTISAYNSQNSLLPSDFISSIAINHETGEVFIATDKGIVSTRGSATKGKSNFNDIYAFPNPVRPEYTGTITITGLITRSNVKITDVSGKLVYETMSVGGQAFWDGTNLWGEKVKSGVYLVFVSSEDGSESGVTKIAVIR